MPPVSRQRALRVERTPVLLERESTGVQPMCLARFGEMGIDFDPTAFGPSPALTTMAWSAR